MSADNKKKVSRFIVPIALALSLMFNLTQIGTIDHLNGELANASQEVARLNSAIEQRGAEPTFSLNQEPSPSPAPTAKNAMTFSEWKAARDAALEEKTESPTASRESEQITVYVSDRSQTIHSKSGCSGMKYYESMTLAEAREITSKYCGNCGSKLKNIK